MARAIFIFALLGGFWLLLSGQFHSLLLLSTGALCVALVVWLGTRMKLFDEEIAQLRIWLRIPAYVPYLIGQIILANLDVLRRIWHPCLPIQPDMSGIPYSTKTAIATTIYANSITLTPGTVTVNVDEHEILIHSLTLEAKEGVYKGSMAQKIHRLEEQD